MTEDHTENRASKTPIGFWITLAGLVALRVLVAWYAMGSRKERQAGSAAPKRSPAKA